MKTKEAVCLCVEFLESAFCEVQPKCERLWSGYPTMCVVSHTLPECCDLKKERSVTLVQEMERIFGDNMLIRLNQPSFP